MKIFYGPRGNGKTMKLFQYARETGATILCNNKRALEVKARQSGYEDLHFCELKDLKDLKRDAAVVVDEALLLFKEYMSYAFNVDLVGVTFGIEEDNY